MIKQTPATEIEAEKDILYYSILITQFDNIDTISEILSLICIDCGNILKPPFDSEKSDILIYTLFEKNKRIDKTNLTKLDKLLN